MNARKAFRDLGQSLWLDNITRDILDNGALRRYIDELFVTGLTSDPCIFDRAIKNSTHYDNAIREKLAEGESGEALFFRIRLEDLCRAADLFHPIHEANKGVDGRVSLGASFFWPTTPPPPLRPRRAAIPAPHVPTSSSNSSGRRQDYLRLRKQSSPVSP